jgi:nitrite reductase/ring-hydroxylating ferredoxin subunit
MTRTVIVKAGAVPHGGAAIVTVDDDLAVAVFRVGEVFYAIDNRCPHKGGPLGGGTLDGALVTCPWHRFVVDVRTGRNPSVPGLRVRTFAVERDGDDLRIALGEAAPG